MVVRLGEVEIDLDRVEIRLSGELQPVQPQVFEVIAYLYERRARLVTKEELLDNVWGDRFVSESTLTSRIKSARRALGDNGRDQSIIRTVHGRGYRFVAEPDGHGDPPGARRRPETTALPAVSPLPPLPPPSESGADDRGTWPLVGRYELIDRIGDQLAEPGVGGVLLVGPAGIGKTRLAVELLRVRGEEGGATHRVTGSAAAAAIPLAALVPLVAPGFAEVGGMAPDVGRSAIFQRALADLVDRSTELGRLLVMVDEVDRLDELSAAVLAAAIDADAVSIVGTRRTGSDSHPFEERVRSGHIREIDVPVLDETDVDVALYRVLGGPVDLASLERLSALSRGVPGQLRDLVESSQASGSLVLDDGVWRLVGPVTSTASENWPPDELSDGAVVAAELLSFVSDLRLGDAESLLGAEAIDALDVAGMLMLERDGDDVTIRLADPLLAETIAAAVGPVRTHRHRAALVEALSRGRARSRDLATIVRWADELDRPLDPFDALLAAQSALRQGNDDDAAVLVDQLDPAAVGPYPAVIRAELAYRRGQHRRAEELFEGVELSEVDVATAGFVLRRLATLRYQLHADYRGAIDWLEGRERGASLELRASLRAHRVTLLTLLGCADEALATAETLDAEAGEARAIELQLASARARLLRGELDRALAMLDDQRSAVHRVRLTGPEARLPAEAALSIRLTAMVDRGDVLAAEQLLQGDAVLAGRTSRTWSPLSAADVMIEVGRARMALELVRPALEMYRATGMHNGRLSCLAMQARAFAEIGQHGRAERALGELDADLDRAVGANRWFVAAAMARAARVLGRGGECVDLLLGQADAAEAWGADNSAAGLLALAAVVGSRDTAAEVIGRLVAVAPALDGRLWPIRIEHVRALAEGRDLAPIRLEYLRLGYRSLAALTAEPERATAEPV